MYMYAQSLYRYARYCIGSLSRALPPFAPPVYYRPHSPKVRGATTDPRTARGDMKRIILILALLPAILLSAPAVSAQDWARQKLEKSPRHREWVTVKHDGRAVETFVVYPESKGKTPVVVVVHEIFGLTDWVEDLADQVAEAGYIAIAPDLLSGMGPNGGRSPDVPQHKTSEAVSPRNPDQAPDA